MHYNLIIFLVFFQDGGEVHFKVKPSTSMGKLKKSYAERQVSVNNMVYWCTVVS